MSQERKDNLYTEKSIESLSPLEFTRLRAGVYAGSTEYSSQLLIEIFSNAVDEYQAGHGQEIEVKIKDNTFTVKDSGQGFLINSMRDDGKTVLEAAFSVMNTSGKYREDGTYEGIANGLNGIGSKLACFLSHTMKVYTQRGGETETIWFKEGVFEKREIGKVNSLASGTTVEWTPSEEFFTNIGVEVERIKNLFETTACLCPGLKIKFDNNGEKITYESKKGLNDLTDKEVKGKELLKNRLVIQEKQDKHILNLVMTFTSDYSAKIIPYVNTGLTDSGVHLTTIKTAITRELNNFYREKGWLKAKDSNLSGDEAQEGMFLIFNMRAPGVAYDAQTKTRVVKLDTSVIMPIFTTKLKEWLAANSKDMKKLCEKALAARKAKEAAKKARDAAREAGVGKATKTKAVDLPSKMSDCWSKDRSVCELYVVEGDSAGGGVKKAKNNEFQALIPVRGKILNTEKASIDKIMKNAEIVDMIKAFGLDQNPVDPTKLIYDESKLRYGKIVISADADDDGGHIQMLFYTFIWNFCPELFIQGKIYATVPPLYKVTEGKDNYLYLQDDKALEEYKENNKNKKYTVNRFKGLGEMNPEELGNTILDPEHRTLKQITIEDAQKAEQLFNDLMGSSAEPRKEYLKIHSKDAQGGV